MQVTNEIRHAFLIAAMNLSEGENPINKLTITTYLNVAFGATETETLIPWLTVHEKRKFLNSLAEMIGSRDLNSDLREDR